MTETLQFLIVTIVALAALFTILRPLLRRKPPQSGSGSGAGGCSNCSASQAPAARKQSS